MPRIFFAVLLPDDIITSLVRLQRKLRSCCDEVKWVEQSNLHLTLQFLGNLDNSRMESLLRDAALSAKELSPFFIQFKGVGAFPNPARARILWTGVGKGSSELSELAASLSRSIGETQDKPFFAHLTLGRVKSGMCMTLPENTGLDFLAGPVNIDSFYCIESILKTQGPVYKIIKKYELKSK